MVKRSRARRTGESVYGLLSLGRVVVLWAVVLVVLAAGAWVSWGTAQHVLLKGRERGTMTVAACGKDTCTGLFTSETGGLGSARAEVTVDRAATRRTGEKIPVALKPSSDEAVRTGRAGVFHAFVPLAGALLLVALVVGGGLRLRRTAWWVGGVGAVLVLGAFVFI